MTRAWTRCAPIAGRALLAPCAQVRRGVMLFAVIVILAVAALAVGALNVAQEAEHAGQVASNDRTQQRAIAWSGAQAVSALLDAQREQIALGEAPDLSSDLVLWESEGRTAVTRLLPVGPMGELAASEMAKRSLATISAEELALTGVVNAELATMVVARRSGCDSIEGLVDPDAGLPPALVLGPAVSTIAESVRSAQEGGRSSVGRDAGGRSAGSGASFDGAARPLALADVVTTFEAQRALGDMESSGPPPRIVLRANGRTTRLLQSTF